MEAPLDAAVGAAPALGLRTRSAQDFGAGFGAGVTGVSSACSAFSIGAAVCSDVVGVARAALCSSEVGAATSAEADPVRFSAAGGDALAFPMIGRFGTAIAVLVSRRACCDCVGVDLGDGTVA